ncbi:MAG TPA: methyltransferase domain-containing protein [Candidatus Cloacimonetes bacterium]|nr:methyltransferase domain-containing protein [Candidatus Cloacimonadota bacterium]
MQYEPIKDRIASLLNGCAYFRVLLYKKLDLLLLRQRYVKSAIDRHLKHGLRQRVYDAGAGYCQYSWHILQRWSEARVFALDLKVDYIRDFAAWLKCEDRKRFSFTRGDLQTYRPKNSYNLILAIDILEHIPDDMAVLAGFYNCLEKGGNLIISTPSDTDEAAKFTAEHVRPGYSIQELVSKLETAGFEIVEKRYSYGFWGSLAWRLSIRNPLRLINKSKLYLAVLPFYLLAVLPFTTLFNHLDMKWENKSGTGIIIVAEK